MVDPKNENAGVGLSDPGISQGRRHMLDLINRLQNTGVQVDMDLPMIAVIGSQSAGKSSLIESIAGITLPRAAGTCTRCPTECRLAFSENAWECKVSLRFFADEFGQPLGTPRIETFGKPITDKAEVEERIRRAQRAILNPKSSVLDFLDGEDEDVAVPQLSFSTNCVSLSISGPNVADLSFCDLPGLIASVGNGGKQSDISLVEGLITSYIQKPSCLILLTVTCETDFENQGAYSLAKRWDPEGYRTIGVLTKPDRIPSGEESRWIRFIRNEIEPLLNNWFCVKQPSSKDLNTGISWSEARQQEHEYFSSKLPWSALDSKFQGYLRTANLTSRLSIILSDLISKRIPGIHEELQKSLEETEAEILKLPTAPSDDPLSEVLQLIGSLVQSLENRVQGTPEADGLLQKLRPAYETFRKAIWSTKPQFRAIERSYANAIGNVREESDEESIAETQSFNEIFIDEIFERAKMARTRELPDNYPFIVQKLYIAEIVTQWQRPAMQLFETIYKKLSEDINPQIIAHFEHIGSGSFMQSVKMLFLDHVNKCRDVARIRINWLLQLEKTPYTINDNYFSERRDKYLAKYRLERSQSNADGRKLAQAVSYYQHSKSLEFDKINAVLSNLTAMGITTVEAQHLVKLLPTDPMEPALQIMASVRAYFEVGYKRIIDFIPMAIDYELTQGIVRGFHAALIAGLKLSGRDGFSICKEFVKEPANVQAHRDDLKKRLERLQMARDELRNVSL